MTNRTGIGVTLALSLALGACAPRPSSEAASPATSDSAFAALQARGGTTMGVDQYTATHQVEALPDGGRIELQRDNDDPAGVAQIRAHLQEVTRAFAAGDFSDPAFVHQREMPGTAVLARKRSLVSYAYSPLPRGGEVRITTADADARRAIHEFLAAQRGDHRTDDHSHR